MPGKSLAIDLEGEAMISQDYEHNLIEAHPLSPHPKNLMRYPTDRMLLEESLDEDGKVRKSTCLGPDPKLI